MLTCPLTHTETGHVIILGGDKDPQNIIMLCYNVDLVKSRLFTRYDLLIYMLGESKHSSISDKSRLKAKRV